MNTIYEKNIECIRRRFSNIYKELENTLSDDSYLGVIPSKKGDYNILTLKNGNALHSKYSHQKESATMFSGKENIVLFCGIGSAYHIRYFLEHFSKKKVFITDATYESLKRLLELCDISDVLSNNNVFLLPPVMSLDFVNCLKECYTPLFMESLTIIPLRSWKSYFFDGVDNWFDKKISIALNDISQDLSTQAMFGKIWMINIAKNLQLASMIKPSMPKVDNTKTAYILGAGPSLDSAIEEIRKKRREIVLFSSDAAFLPLLKHKISPDFFISIDPQIICSTHCIAAFSKDVIGIFNLTSSPPLVRQFVEKGCKIIFTHSSHPFSIYANLLSPFPKLDAGSGSVAIAALNVARSLGFTKIEGRGVDFAYTKGAAYARGVYLSVDMQKDISRFNTEESFFVRLMFRGATNKCKEGDRITYKTDLLSSYARSFYSNEDITILWKDADFASFPYVQFLKKLKYDFTFSYENLRSIFLPFICWAEMKKNGINIEKNDAFLIEELVLKKIFML